jgi:predicted nucleic acid-binding Zn ribbon protein
VSRPSRDPGGRFPAKWTPARHLLEEWRGLPEGERPDRALSISSVLGELIPKLGLQNSIREADILAAWRGVVGDFISAHSRPERLVGGVLSVRVLQSSVRYELDRTWKPKILEKLRAEFGEKSVREIRFIL